MNIEVIITAIIGVFTTAASSLITWLFSKRKYNAEVDNNVINNKPIKTNPSNSSSISTANQPKELESRLDSIFEHGLLSMI